MLATLCCGAHGADAGREPITVQDLHYGEVLFYFYQDDYFGALTHLLTAKERDRVSHHQEEAELLLGGLYLSYGQHRLAGEIFERLLEDSVSPEFRDRAWFFMAKVWYQRGYLPESEAALNRIQGELIGPLETERHMMRSQLMMEQGRFDEARVILENFEGPRDWSGYSRYNLGVALVRLERTAEGAALLDDVGQLEPRNEEMAGLRDKANVALGYAWLQAERPELARPALQRVRLSGPFSTKALLGVGWSDSAEEQYRRALVPWMELRRRNLLDPAVQESLLAVPYALAKLDANKQAADYYLDAIEAFHEEIDRLDQSIASIKSGELLTAVLAQDSSSKMGWYWQLDDLPDVPETRYLYELMASHRFQEGLKNYRDLVFMRANLDHWVESLAAFDDMLDTREYAYQQRLPHIEASLSGVDPDELGSRLLDLKATLKGVERDQDPVALGTVLEQQNWELLVNMEPKLAMFLNDPEVVELAAKQQFLKGLVYWDLSRQYKARLWRQTKALREADAEVKTAQRRYHRVDKMAREWPERFAQLSARVEGLNPRVGLLANNVDNALGRQRAFLEDVAVDELQAQKQRLDTYMVQARFALASIYDRASAQVTPSFDDVDRAQP
jgi:hypothetical protein